ncbi:MAG TPA: acetate--CoA ligase family protein, partial [Candidatus Binatia bacterium]
VAHRSDAGLVSAKISSDAELNREYDRLATNARALSQGDPAVSVEKFVAHDFEMILGLKHDATFGPVVLCGLGGIFTEVLKDYSLRLAPLTEIDAAEMLSSLKAFGVLQKSSAGLKGLTGALLQLSDLAVELNGKIKAVDINPIGFTSHSSEMTVLDAKIHL